MSKKFYINCLSEEVKDILSNLIEDTEIIEIIKEIPVCPDDKPIELDYKKKRTPSAYNKFIASCMKEEGKSLKECANLWKEKKKEGNN